MTKPGIGRTIPLAVGIALLLPCISCGDDDAGGQTGAVPAYFDWWREGGRLAVGKPIPDVPLYDLEGNEARLGSFAGRRYMLVVWGSW